jgi:hypothetical protein
MPTLVAYPEFQPRWEHLLLGLRDPGIRVAVVAAEPPEPALLSYYLELAGVGPWGRLAVFDPADTGGLRAFVGDDADESPRAIDPGFASGSRGATAVHVVIRPDRRVQVMAAFDREPCRHPASGDVGPLFREAARVGAELSSAGASGRFAVELGADGLAVGVDPAASDHALATMLALRANAVRAGWIGGSFWPVVESLRASGVAWNPVARAGVVAYPGADGVELVALGGARLEAEERFASACAALEPLAVAA